MEQKYKFTYECTYYKEHFGEHLSIEQAAFVAGVKPDTVKNLILREIIQTSQFESQIYIHVRQIPKLKKIIRLHYDLGIGWNSMGIVIELLDKIEELEKKLEH